MFQREGLSCQTTVIINILGVFTGQQYFQNNGRKPLKTFSTAYRIKKPSVLLGFFLLPNQGSNLDFTDPESVVLPITPLGTNSAAKVLNWLIMQAKKATFFYFSSKKVVFLPLGDLLQSLTGSSTMCLLTRPCG